MSAGEFLRSIMYYYYIILNFNSAGVSAEVVIIHIYNVLLTLIECITEHVQCVMIHYESSHGFHGVLPQYVDMRKHEPVTRVKHKLALAGIWVEFRHEFLYYQ